MFFGLLVMVASKTRATHIIGGELTYTCGGDNMYTVNLVIYRNCAPDNAEFDDPGYFFVYDLQDNYIAKITSYPVSIVNVDHYVNNPCLDFPTDLCVERAIYTEQIRLTPNRGTFQIVYQRCCRTTEITNVVDPGDIGSTYIINIPTDGEKACNNSSVFNNYPPVAVCLNDFLTFDHSARDPDGDSLVYEICHPNTFVYLDECYQPGHLIGCDYAEMPPGLIEYTAGYSYQKPLDADPAFVIDPVTGILTGTPTQMGIFVVGICVSEYRNGILTGVNKRDFQFNVVYCDVATTSSIPEGDHSCDGLTVEFANSSNNATFYSWDFGVAGISSDISDEYEPTYTFPDTGSYLVTLITNPGYGCADTAFALIELEDVLDLGMVFEDGCENTDIEFFDVSTTIFGSISKRLWEFVGVDKTAEQNPAQKFDEAGTYEIKLTVTMDIGCESTMYETIEIFPAQAPSALHTKSCFGDLTYFTNTSTINSGTIDSYVWQFGDGDLDTAKTPSHTYKEDGIFTLWLVGTSDHECAGYRDYEIDIFPNPSVH